MEITNPKTKLTGKYSTYIVALCGVCVLAFTLMHTSSAQKQAVPVAAVVEPISGTNPFTILIVPGHDTDTDCNTNTTCNSGAVYRNVYERDLVVTVSKDISTLLASDPKYKIIVARDTKAWNPIFSNYFANNQQAIVEFKDQHQAAYKLLLASGQQQVLPDMAEHTPADEKTSVELYGINKWADENKVDLIIHLHFNNQGRKNSRVPGKDHGFDIFIPDHQWANGAASRTVAEDIYTELQKKFSPEAPGSHYESLFEDQSLIALGASDTLTKPALLIEYAYVYEKMLQTSASRKQALGKMAEQTVAGIKDYVSSISP